eukprot:g63778.t1
MAAIMVTDVSSRIRTVFCRPKWGCEDNGGNCISGQMPPCGKQGCDPPAETKVEFNFNDPKTNDISLVDGYGLPVVITPNMPSSATWKDCVITACDLSFDECPTNEIDGLGDLRVIKDGKHTNNHNMYTGMTSHHICFCQVLFWEPYVTKEKQARTLNRFEHTETRGGMNASKKERKKKDKKRLNVATP